MAYSKSLFDDFNVRPNPITRSTVLGGITKGVHSFKIISINIETKNGFDFVYVKMLIDGVHYFEDNIKLIEELLWKLKQLGYACGLQGAFTLDDVLNIKNASGNLLIDTYNNQYGEHMTVKKYFMSEEYSLFD